MVPNISQEWTVSQIIENVPPQGWDDLFEKHKPEIDHISQHLHHREKTEGPSLSREKKGYLSSLLYYSASR